jgi:putative nucleotidyltransferase with HDIG domain
MRNRGLSPAARSVTLLRTFVVASGVILLAGALFLGRFLTQAVESQVVSDRKDSLAQYVDGVLRPSLVQRDRVVVGAGTTHLLAGELERQGDLVTVKVWRPDGVLAWTNRVQSRIGRRFPLSGSLGTTIRENRTTGEIDRLDSEEDQVEARLGFDHMLEVYAPIRASNGAVLGAYEIYANPASVESFIAGRKHAIWGVVALVFLTLYLALALLVRGASSLLQRQTRQLGERSKALMDSYRQLEERSLEAVETLNAIVDAKDAYTAGHSQRVQRIALSIAAELDFSPSLVDALRYGALFHDIGKLRVPDAVLTKPGPLTPDEFDLIKRHPGDGADIVSHLSRLRESVPIIRHHHERWDGSGYPDRLAGETISLEAGVAGIADAWDAMTTDRPYHRALSEQEALTEIREGRATQFHPAVVDAFFRAIKRRPGDFAPEVPIARAAAALAG